MILSVRKAVHLRARGAHGVIEPKPSGWGSPVPLEAAPRGRLLGNVPPLMIEMIDYVFPFSAPCLAPRLHT